MQQISTNMLCLNTGYEYRTSTDTLTFQYYIEFGH